jgi:DNA-binding NtrC family response regulator
MRAGCLDFLPKPVTKDVFVHAVGRALELSMASREARLASRELQSAKSPDGLIGHSQRWLAVVDQIQRVKSNNVPVLLLGETGVGKEVVAQAIHASGERAAGPFIAVNLSAISSLVESSLFGYRRGAFTGATENRAGLFEAADGGTLFLDEIGDIPAEIQVKLLRVLQGHRVTRLGDVAEIPVDVRVICATNRDLKRAVAEGRFREDLYFRICAFAIELPPLRQRLEDIPLLAAHLLEINRASIKGIVQSIGHEAMEMLQEYHWPGNVRELNAVIQRAMIVANGPTIETQDLNLGIGVSSDSTESWYRLTWQGAKDAFAQAYFSRVLVRANGDRTKAAKLAGVDRSVMHDRLKKIETSCPPRGLG